MAGYIKSHSNYRLQTRHQTVDGGLILERDISTVGGVNSFATGQAAIYQSGNFVMLVNNSSPASRNIRKEGWLPSGDGDDTWSAVELQEHFSDINGSVEESIRLKNDFMDFRSFAYYGSLSSLIQGTVSTIITEFPYEMYIKGGEPQETEHISGGTITLTDDFIISVGGVPYRYKSLTVEPGHSISLDTEGVSFIESVGGSYRTVQETTVTPPINAPTILFGAPLSGPTSVDYSVDFIIRKLYNPGEIDIYNYGTSESMFGKEPLGHFFNGGYKNYGIYYEGYNNPEEGFEIVNWYSRPYEHELCPKPFVAFSTAIISAYTPSYETAEFRIDAYWDEALRIKYTVCKEPTGEHSSPLSVHIRPKMSDGRYEEFIDSLDLFGKCLMGEYTGIRNTARFEVLRETDNGTVKELREFVFPIGEGGYNISPDSLSMEEYVSSLGKIGIEYDEAYTDNLFRMMTHDSLKNLDWTRYAYDGDDNYVKTGEKFAAVVRLMGYVFDNEKAYIDSMGHTNSITYSDRSSLSDYFLTDSLETDGWNVVTVYPYSLTEYDESGSTVTVYDEDEQYSNEYERKFTEVTSDTVSPYAQGGTSYYTKCVDGQAEDIEVDVQDGSSVYVDGDRVYNIISEYSDESEYTIPDVNNEFMKSLRINSRHILRKKGTVEGIESVLSLFGMRSRRFADEGAWYDFDISEKTYITKPITDTEDPAHGMYRIDWYNSCKTIPYNSISYLNGEYVPYQGLPVAYREVVEGGVKKIRLYPFFDGHGEYDGNMYYQMNGGWIGYSPYRFGIKDRILKQDSSLSVRVETMRNIMQVANMSELVSQPQSELFDGITYYVTDTSENFALIDGHPYRLFEDLSDGSVKYFFMVEVFGAAVVIGDTVYEQLITVSNGNGQDGTSIYDLSLYSDGSAIRIYYTGDRSNPFIIESNTMTPGSSLIFTEGTYFDDVSDIPSHYFVLNDTGKSGYIGEGCWEQISEKDPLFEKIENITDNTEANNPHSSNYAYDNGKEYLDRFRKLFKYASENRMFNESCFPSVDEAYTQIDSYGFTLSEVNDTKVHSFVDRINDNGTVTWYSNTNKDGILSIPEYAAAVSDSEGMDGVTSQILNTKLVELKFRIHTEDTFSKEAQEEIKYIQAKVMPYVEQMIPSTAILNVSFETEGGE